MAALRPALQLAPALVVEEIEPLRFVLFAGNDLRVQKGAALDGALQRRVKRLKRVRRRVDRRQSTHQVGIRQQFSVAQEAIVAVFLAQHRQRDQGQLQLCQVVNLQQEAAEEAGRQFAVFDAGQQVGRALGFQWPHSRLLKSTRCILTSMNLVIALSKYSSTLPVGPWRCLESMTSA